MMPSAELKRLVRYFYDPSPKFDEESGASIWLLGKEYKTSSLPPIITTDREDVVEIESSTDSHDPSEATASTTEEAAEHTTGITKEDKDKTRDSIDDVHRVEGQNLPSLSNDPADGGWPHAFIDDFESRIWMTYRSNFFPIPRSQDPAAFSNMSFSTRLRSFAEGNSFSSDTGWGCMIRSGQSLLANALLTLHLGRDWRYKIPKSISEPHATEPSISLDSEAAILALFADSPTAPFGIHRFVSHGATSCSTHPGQWFGPSATASCIAALTPQYPAANLRIYSTPSTDIYEDKFRSIAAASATDATITPTLILLGIRLGLDRITPVYHEALKRSLTYPQSIGIAGGRPSSSHYFVGIHNETFFYLDPHETRTALPSHASPAEYTPEEIATCHTRRLRGLRIADMDPSMLMGFLIRDEADWEDWKRRLNEVPGKKIVNVYAKEPPVPGVTHEREGAVDEVETFDDEDEEGDDKTEKGD
ncbi:Cysteine protease atg4 [Neophaeococcomyces mojaviensis]|uniref:Cysteine protease atg4 n=1 Tax=Neophaeococcomyces mojaviensis TaxID=3383035 RepID=A0ACC3ACN3_9EURO|nr:Cysteine protease atg4 [Knufia sp. JES_112]